MLCGFEDSQVASIQDHLEKETQSRLLIATTCLDSSILLPTVLEKLPKVLVGPSEGGGGPAAELRSTIPAPSAVTLWNYQMHQETCF